MRQGLHAHNHRAYDVLAASLPFTLALGSLSSRAARSCGHWPPHLAQRQRRRFISSRYVSTKATSALHELAQLSRAPGPFVFRSSSTNPYHNLSIEDYLLRNSDHSSLILLFYTNRPCVVIGRNQNPWLECNLQQVRNGLPREKADREHNFEGIKNRNVGIPIDLVRRRSGGGTVFHDLGNLNYSVIVPNDKEFNRRKHAEMVVRGLNNITSYEFHANIKVNERHDIVMQKHGQAEWLKISGSAFKLTKGRALHHGTLLCSSPYLHQISGLLRSPGREYIHAKGVESVRSKVGNLTWIESPAKREMLRAAITDSVMAEFLALYGAHNEVRGPPVDVSDEDCNKDTNPAIATGVKELMANEWRFGQTPRFEFDSGTMDGTQFQFEANRGLIETLRLVDTATGKRYIAEERPSTQHHLNSISNWKSLIGDIELSSEYQDETLLELTGVRMSATRNRSLIRRLESVFPYFD